MMVTPSARRSGTRPPGGRRRPQERSAGLAEAVGKLRAAQQRHHQSLAAYQAAEPLRAFTANRPVTEQAGRDRATTLRAGPEPPSRRRAR